MPAYLIFRMSNVTDPAKIQAYREDSPATIAAFGGRMLAAGAAETHEGPEETARTGIIEFKDMDTARAWITSPEYKAVQEARMGAADIQLILVDGLPS